MDDEVGFVYVISNPTMPGVVKIGVTQSSPSKRAAELVSTGVPEKFRVDYFCVVYQPYAVESAVHAVLAKQRRRGEWFSITTYEAVGAIRDAGVKILDEAWNEELQQELEFLGPDDVQFDRHIQRQSFFWSSGNHGKEIFGK